MVNWPSLAQRLSYLTGEVNTSPYTRTKTGPYNLSAIRESSLVGLHVLK